MVTLALGELYQKIGCQVCYVLSQTTFGRGHVRNSPEKIKSAGSVCRARLCDAHKVGATRSKLSAKRTAHGARNVLCNT